MRGSAPVVASRGPTVLLGIISSASSRCTGSAVGLPWVRAERSDAVTASRLIAVSFVVSRGAMWVHLL
jgi:hypothetical protein